MSTAPPSLPATSPRRAAALPSWRELKAIADAQRRLMIALLLGLFALPAATMLSVSSLPQALGSAEVGVTVMAALLVGVRVWMAVATYRLARALGSKVALLWALGGFLPNLIGLLVLVVLSSRATRRLKKAGLKVGLLGARLAERPPPGFLCQELEQEFA